MPCRVEDSQPVIYKNVSSESMSVFSLQYSNDVYIEIGSLTKHDKFLHFHHFFSFYLSNKNFIIQSLISEGISFSHVYSADGFTKTTLYML